MFKCEGFVTVVKAFNENAHKATTEPCGSSNHNGDAIYCPNCQMNNIRAAHQNKRMGNGNKD